MLLVKYASDDTGPKGTSWVERTASVEHPDQLGHEEREADADGGDEGRLVLLLCQHEDLPRLRRQ